MSRGFFYQLRRDTAANWTSVNPTLGDGEPGLETDTGYLKLGNGSTAWAGLPYINVITRTPSSAGDTGIAGQMAADSSYIYRCTATNTWKRTAISTW